MEALNLVLKRSYGAGLIGASIESNIVVSSCAGVRLDRLEELEKGLLVNPASSLFEFG